MKISELKGKHDHALTSWLKVIIFSLLMIAPLFASISQWVYVSVNKNAKDSYSNINSVAYTNANTQAQIIGMTYQVRYNPNGNNNAYQYLNVLNGQTNVNEIYLQEPYKSKTIDRITIESNGNSLYCYFTDSSYYGVQNWYEISYVFNYVASTTNTLQDFSNRYYSIYRMDYTTEKLDNAFYYGVEKMTESDLFNWTQNTTLYSGIKTMTDNLEIQTPAIAILLTYWFILTIIYVIIDIVLKGFTTLTHLIMGAK